VLASDGQAFMNRKNLGLIPSERDWKEMAKLNGEYVGNSCAKFEWTTPLVIHYRLQWIIAVIRKDREK